MAMVGLHSQICESKTTLKIKSNMKEKLLLDWRMLMQQLEEGSCRSLSDSVLIFSRTEINSHYDFKTTEEYRGERGKKGRIIFFKYWCERGRKFHMESPYLFLILLCNVRKILNNFTFYSHVNAVMIMANTAEYLGWIRLDTF